MSNFVIVVSAILVYYVDRQTESHTDTDEHCTPATVVGVRNKSIVTLNFAFLNEEFTI